MIVTGGITRRRRAGRTAAAAAGLLGLAVTLLLAGSGSAAAQTGSWTLTGSMSSARSQATATLLQNGEVLVAGGSGAANAEVYNPATGTWTPTGPMTAVRIGQVAALLQNGEVLVAGGEGDDGALLGTAEVYNPATGTWAATGPMATEVGTGATATVLPNGTVLVAGGCCTPEAGPGALAEAQIYNPATNSWTATGSMSTGRYYATATLLGNGTVLVVGGDNIVPNMMSGMGSSPLTSAEIYNPATGSWQSAGNTATGHVWATASLLPSGQVLVAGGSLEGCCGGVTGADLYTPSTGTWQAAANMNVAREDAAAVVLPNGTVLMTGGYNGITATAWLASTEIYQPSTNTWTVGPSMNAERAYQTATLLPDGQVLVAGGSNGSNALASAELYSAGTTSTPAPAVTAVSPASGPAAGGTTVTVTGTNLTGGSVAFGGVAATGVSCTASSCSATSPAGSGTVNVTVTTAGGTSAASSADQFTYQAAAPPPAPTISSITPTSGPAAGGTTVTVTGSNLTGGSVAFGTAAATGVSCAASSCTATSPAGSGTVNVTVTTAGGTSATSAADQFTYTAAPPPSNLIPDPDFATSAVPADYWGSTVARSQAVVYPGSSWSLAQTATSSSGGWDLDDNPAWYAPVSSADSYTAGIWVYATAAVKVDLNLDLLTASGGYVDSATGPTVTLAAGTWTHLTVTGIQPAAGEVYGGMEPDFLKATKGTIIYWDNMSLVVS
jgi:hypothetical protein